MKRRREFLVANGAALFVLLVVLLLGWKEEAAFGFAVLLVLDLLVFFRERSAGSDRDEQDGEGT